MGLLDTVLKLINIEDAKQDGFRFVAVNGDHEFIHDPPVRASNSITYIVIR